MTAGPTGPAGGGPVLDYHKPEPDKGKIPWFVGGLLLGGATVMGGILIAILAAYASQSSWAYLIVLLAGVVFLGGITALVSRRRRRPFALGLLTGCLIGAAIEGLCVVAGLR